MGKWGVRVRLLDRLAGDGEGTGGPCTGVGCCKLDVVGARRLVPVCGEVAVV
jgi:hypothetical protein